MRARPLLLASVAVLAALSAVPATGAATARFVPSLVLDGTVSAYVTDLAAGDEVALEVGDTSVTKEALEAGGVLVQLSAVPPGLHEWSLGVTADNVTTVTTGFVLVDGQVGELRAAFALQDEAHTEAVANLTSAWDAFAAGVRERQDLAFGNLSALLDSKPLVSIGNATLLDPAPPPADPPQPAQAAPASAAPGWGAAALPVGALALLLLPAQAVMLLQARKGRREALAMLLVLAAKAGITPDSPELQGALKAIDGRRRGKRDDAPQDDAAATPS